MSLEPWINCRDIQKSIRFYTEILDFEIQTPPDPAPDSHDALHALLRRGEFVLHLDAHARDAGVFGAGFYVRVDNVDALFERFCANGLNTTDRESTPCLRGGPVDQSWGMREFRLKDPDGNGVTYGQNLRP